MRQLPFVWVLVIPFNEDNVHLDLSLRPLSLSPSPPSSTSTTSRLTGCIKGFSEVENHIENVIKSRNYINKFWALKTVIEVKLSLLCHSLFLEKFNFNYSFQGPEFANKIFTFYY